MSSSPTKIELPCDAQGCDQVAGIITNGSLTIISRHHGKRHPKTITLVDLLRLLTEQSDTKLLTDRESSVICSAPVAPSHR